MLVQSHFLVFFSFDHFSFGRPYLLSMCIEFSVIINHRKVLYDRIKMVFRFIHWKSLTKSNLSFLCQTFEVFVFFLEVYTC